MQLDPQVNNYLFCGCVFSMQILVQTYKLKHLLAFNYRYLGHYLKKAYKRLTRVVIRVILY